MLPLHRGLLLTLAAQSACHVVFGFLHSRNVGRPCAELPWAPAMRPCTQARRAGAAAAGASKTTGSPVWSSSDESCSKRHKSLQNSSVSSPSVFRLSRHSLMASTLHFALQSLGHFGVLSLTHDSCSSFCFSSSFSSSHFPMASASASSHSFFAFSRLALYSPWQFLLTCSLHIFLRSSQKAFASPNVLSVLPFSLHSLYWSPQVFSPSDVHFSSASDTLPFFFLKHSCASPSAKHVDSIFGRMKSTLSTHVRSQLSLIFSSVHRPSHCLSTSACMSSLLAFNHAVGNSEQWPV
mmetsp:Transcript_38336/g.118294  ORF Transcript_38336/g.118294 Transcript_38336/m.118294 type:complete len:294 (+) Transcript_38336:43-924(+)